MSFIVFFSGCEGVSCGLSASCGVLPVRGVASHKTSRQSQRWTGWWESVGIWFLYKTLGILRKTCRIHLEKRHHDQIRCILTYHNRNNIIVKHDIFNHYCSRRTLGSSRNITEIRFLWGGGGSSIHQDIEAWQPTPGFTPLHSVSLTLRHLNRPLTYSVLCLLRGFENNFIFPLLICFKL